MLRLDAQNILTHLLVSDMRMFLEIVCSCVAWESVLRAAFDDTILKQYVYAFKWHVLCLRNTEDGVESHKHAACSEEKESAIGDVGQHDRRQLGNDEVEEPLAH